MNKLLSRSSSRIISPSTVLGIVCLALAMFAIIRLAIYLLVGGLVSL